MSRFANPANSAAFQAEHVDYAVACELNFVSGFVRAFLGTGVITINGNTYNGVGGFGSIGVIQERPDGRNFTELTLSLSGIDPSMLARAPVRSEYYGRYGNVYLVAFNTQTMQPITPVEAAIFNGFMDTMIYQRKQGAASIQMSLKHFDSIYNKSVDIWYTNDHQNSLYAGDTFLDQLPAIQDATLVWGGSVVPTNGLNNTSANDRQA